jgi:hypothetical protein
MTLERQASVLGLHPFTVVFDTQELFAAELNRDGDTRRVRIE